MNLLASILLYCGTFVPVPYNDSYICVSPDYYMEDGIRVPLTVSEAKQIAENNNWKLPTKDMVDTIWSYADLKLEPITMSPGPDMTSEAYIRVHNNLINEQIAGRSFTLVAGHKKDMLDSSTDSNMTIYGWHTLSGIPIQPPFSGHSADYRDYSQGVRFIK